MSIIHRHGNKFSDIFFHSNFFSKGFPIISPPLPYPFYPHPFSVCTVQCAPTFLLIISALKSSILHRSPINTHFQRFQCYQGWTLSIFLQMFGKRLVPTVKKVKFQVAVSFKCKNRTSISYTVFSVFLKIPLTEDILPGTVVFAINGISHQPLRNSANRKKHFFNGLSYR